MNRIDGGGGSAETGRISSPWDRHSRFHIPALAGTGLRLTKVLGLTGSGVPREHALAGYDRKAECGRVVVGFSLLTSNAAGGIFRGEIL